MKKANSGLLYFILVPFLCVAQANLNFSIAPDTATLFAEGIVNTTMYERDFALSPDGTELFYTVFIPSSGFQTIIQVKKDKTGKWSLPAVASFSGKYTDLEPAFTADGKKLFFCSNRPLDEHTAKSDFDIWYVEKINGQWVNPKNAGAAVNTSANEYYPSVAKNGNLYFTAAYTKGIGREDIYLAKWNNGKYDTSLALDTNVNSSLYEFNAFVSPDEHYILFTSYGRKDDKGGGDIYISIKDKKGNWQPAQNLTIINSNKLDYCPFVSFDQKILFFTSERHSMPVSFADKPVTYQQLINLPKQMLNGAGNIYWTNFTALMKKINP